MAITSGAEGFGNLFLGLSLLAAGWAIVSEKALPMSLGWVSLIGGVATVARVLGLNDPVTYFASLVIAGVVFCVWAGNELRKGGT